MPLTRDFCGKEKGEKEALPPLSLGRCLYLWVGANQFGVDFGKNSEGSPLTAQKPRKNHPNFLIFPFGVANKGVIRSGLVSRGGKVRATGAVVALGTE